MPRNDFENRISEVLQRAKEHTEHSHMEISKTISNLLGDIKKEIHAIHKRLDQQDAAIAPAIETIKTFQNGRQFIVYMIPVFVFIGALVAFIKKM